MSDMNEELNTELEDGQEVELEDRGDVVSPDLPDDEQEEELDAGGSEADEPELDADALRELAEGGPEDKPRMIPHARFNEVNESLKAEREARLRLEEELARSRGTQPAAKKDPEKEAGFDFDEAEDRYAAAMYEGSQEEARKIRGEIRAAERAEMKRLAEEEADARYQARMAERDQAQQQASLQKTADDLVQKYPFLDPSSAEADADAIADVVALRDSYMGRGMSPVDALTKAADRVAALNGHKDEPEPEKVKPTREQLERNLGRERQIPARDKGIGERANKIDYGALSEKEFASMSESEKKKARGDYVG